MIIRSEDSIDSNSSNNIEFCANCGEKIDDNSQYCDACGYDIQNDIPAEIEDKNNNTLFYIIGMIAVILILTTAVGIYLSHGNTTINGVNFNIPNGYVANMQRASGFESLLAFGNNNNLPYHELQVYEKGSDTVTIAVADNTMGSESSLPFGTPMKIKGHDGVVSPSFMGWQSFCYYENGKRVVVIGNMNTIETVIPYDFIGMIGGK